MVVSVKGLKGLTFRMCALGNLFFDEKLCNLYAKLRVLRMDTDEFGNRGLKILMLN